MQCKATEEKQRALCHKPCMDGFRGRGPVCWQKCPEGYNSCGAMCLADGTKCGGMIFKQIGKVMKAIVDISNNKDKSTIVNIAELGSAF